MLGLGFPKLPGEIALGAASTQRATEVVVVLTEVAVRQYDSKWSLSTVPHWPL
jgi:hypothetical protein